MVEGRYRDILLTAIGVDVAGYPDMTDLRPDLVVVMRRTADNTTVTEREIRPDGSVKIVTPSDSRAALRVVDLKFAEQLNIAYAGEVCLYSMVLAAWLEHPDIALADRFYVSAVPGVLVRHTDRAASMPSTEAPLADRTGWFESQIDPAEADLYAPPVVRFFRDDLQRVLASMADWRNLEWHVSPTCAFCDYLGYPGWSKRGITDVESRWARLKRTTPVPTFEDYCHEDARRNNRLNHLPNTTRGMLRTLQRGQVNGLCDLRARADNDAVFGKHNGLRIESRRLPRKAGAVVDAQKSEHPLSMSGQLARYADLLVTIVCFFDAATGLLTSLGMGVDYKSPTEWADGVDKEGRPARVPVTPRFERRQQLMFVMEGGDRRTAKRDTCSTASRFPIAIPSSSSAVRMQRPPKRPTRRHGQRTPGTMRVSRSCSGTPARTRTFRKAIGRHLHQITHSGVDNALLWLFPPREVEQSDSIATTPAVCHLHDAVIRLVALPTIINDDILSVANQLADFKDDATPYMWDRVAGVIPKERSLEISQRMPPKSPPMSISQCIDQYRGTLRTVIHGMRQITFSVQRDFGKQLKGDAGIDRGRDQPAAATIRAAASTARSAGGRIAARPPEDADRAPVDFHEYKEKGFNVPESLFERALNDRVREQFGDRVKCTKTLQAQGTTFESYAQRNREQLIIDLMTHEFVSGDKIVVSPHKIEVYYGENPDHFKLPDQIKLRMIVITQTADAVPRNGEETGRRDPGQDPGRRFVCGYGFDLFGRFATVAGRRLGMGGTFGLA